MPRFTVSSKPSVQPPQKIRKSSKPAPTGLDDVPPALRVCINEDAPRSPAKASAASAPTTTASASSDFVYDDVAALAPGELLPNPFDALG